MPITLRDDDQAVALQTLRDTVRSGVMRIIMQAPTGFGKTVLSGGLIESALEKKKRVTFTVPAIQLIDQTIEMFYRQGIRDVGVIQALHEMTDWSQPVQIASVQTLQKRSAPLEEGGPLRLPEGHVIIIDEVHRWYQFYEKMICEPALERVPIIGLSATPWTKGLGAYFDKLIVATTIRKLIERGRLSPFKVYAPTHPDLKGVRTVAGDYHEGDLSERMNTPALVADIVKTWQKLGQDRPTLGFAVDRAHAKKLQERFLIAGIPTEYQDAHTSMSDRAIIKHKFHDGRIKVVWNVGTLTTGVDWDVRCEILARPTKSEMLFVQIIGRGLRTADGKDYCLILDHSDNHDRMGFVTDIDEAHQGLHDGKTPLSSDPTVNAARLPKECPNCGFLKAPKTARCPACGTVTEAHSKIEEAEGELAEVTRGKKSAPPVPGEKVAIYGGLKFIAKEKGYKDGWAANKYKAIFGVWPKGMRYNTPTPPSYELLAWVQQSAQNYARRKRYAEGKDKRTKHRQAEEQAAQFGSKAPLMTEQDWQDFK